MNRGIFLQPKSLLKHNFVRNFIVSRMVTLTGDGACEGSQPQSGESTPQLSKNQEKNEAKRKAKLEKFLAKQAKLEQQAKGVTTSSNGEKKKKESSLKNGKKEPFINKTPPGEKKDMSGPMAAAFDPQAVESAWYSWWEKKEFFKPSLGKDGKCREKGTFVIPIPPPNVTGSLHLGHALGNSIQDLLIRWNRMRGLTTLWIPGCDHAGIATQVVVEKKLMRTRGLTRHDLGREKFIEQVFEWKNEKEARIYDQLRRLGTSYDWERAKFTMDPPLADAVTEAFCLLFEDGTIYRDNRLVNWDTKLKTALSNLEVDSMELEGRTLLVVPDHDPKRKYEFGVLHSFAYPIENSDERVVVATTRIETMLGDTAIAVHPTDARYKHLHGKFVVHPFQDRRIPIILDEMVDPEFGTGCVKITPAHDFNDYEVGKRHSLPFINILNEDGTMNDNAAPFTGRLRFDVRVAVIKALQERGLYVEKKDNKMVLPICSRSGNVVEPLIKAQWWVNCQDIAKPALEAVVSGKLDIQPKSSEKEWFRWLENIQDWCISRQLWWGHQVPAYLVKIKGGNPDPSDGKNYVCGRSIDEARAKASLKYPDVSPEDIELERDPDVLDTWFSSGLWPFSVLGWPKKTKDLDLFYPNTLLETGWDILFFWVARMVMLGIKLTGQVPFSKVYCHAVIRDAHGRKMSKSLGNVIDPIHVIEGITLQDLHKTLQESNLEPKEIARATETQKKDFPRGIIECGTDALRFSLCSYTNTGREINLDISRVEAYRKFCNKLWNAVRFALLKLGEGYKPPASAELPENAFPAAQWILHKLNATAREMNEAIPAYNFVAATSSIYLFLLNDLCDVYIEVVKPIIDLEKYSAEEKQVARDALYIALESGLRLMHPFMPYLTEELWQRLPRYPGDSTESVMVSSYPEYIAERDIPGLAAEYERVKNIVFATRSIMTENNLDKSARVHVCVTDESSSLDLLQKCERDIYTLTKGFQELSFSDKPLDTDGVLVREAHTGIKVFVLGEKKA